MSRTLLSVGLLTAVYLLTLASADPVDAATGVLLAVAAVALSRRLGREAGAPEWPLLSRLAGVPRLAWAVLRDITLGTWEVALIVLRVRPLGRPGLIAVPIGDRTPLGTTVGGLLLTLAPGEFLVDVDWERGVMLVHVIDASDPDAVRRAHAEFYERYQRTVVP